MTPTSSPTSCLERAHRRHDDAPTVSVPRVAPVATLSSSADSEPTEAVYANEATVQWANGLTPVDADTRAGLDTPPVLPEAADRPAGLHPIMSPEDYKKARAGEPTSHRGRNLLILAILLALLVFAVGYWFSIGRYVTTPSLTGNAESPRASRPPRTQGFKFKVSVRSSPRTTPSAWS